MRLGTRVALLGLSLAPMAALGDASPQVTLAVPGWEGGALTRFTLRFSQAMVPLGDPRAAAPATTTCPGGSDGRWVDQQTYVFRFAKPLAGGTRCTFALRDGLRSAAGYALIGRRASFSVDAGGPSARAVLPAAGSGDGGGIEEDQVFLVAANMPAVPASVAANAYCAVDGIGEKIPVEVLPSDLPARLIGQLGPDDYQVRSFIDRAGEVANPNEFYPGVIALRCRRPLPPGRDMALIWGAGIVGLGGRTAGADQRFDYTVRKPFAARFECSRVNPQAGCSPVEKAFLRFSAPVPRWLAEKARLTLSDGRAIAPTFTDAEKHAATISDVTFAAPLPYDTDATLSLPAGVKDESGRPLSNAERFPLEVRFDRAPPLVKFAGAFGILESQQGGMLPVTVRNVEPALQGRNLAVAGRRARVADDDGQIAAWLRRITKAGESDFRDEKRGKVTVPVNHTGDAPVLPGDLGNAFRLAAPEGGRRFEVIGIPLHGPGFYVVELASPALGRALLGRPAPRYVATAALVTNLSVHFKWGRERSLAWVTELASGRPAGSVAVQVTDSCTGRAFARGITDALGGVYIPKGLPDPQTYGSCEEGSSHPLMISARRAGDMSFTLTSWGEGIQPSDFSLPYGYQPPAPVIHTVFDRTLVRAGETIRMKHIVRAQSGTGFAIPADFTGTLRLQHRGSDTQFDLPLKLTNGTGETSWTAPSGAPMGDYDLTVIGPKGVSIDTGQSFRLDEYKLPTMRAAVTGPKGALVQPRSVPLDLFVGYLSGGGAANLPVDLRTSWSVRADAPAGYDGYTFGGERIREGTRPDNEDAHVVAQVPPTQTMPASLRGDGTQHVVAETPEIDTAADLRIEMDYQDANGEVLTASRTLPVFPAAVQLGIATDGWLMKHDELRLKFVALDTAGHPIAGQHLSVQLYSRETLTARRRLIGGFYAYDNQQKTTRIAATCSPTTDAQGLAHCAIDPGVSGEVYAVATTADASGNTARAVTSVWLAGDEQWWFGGDNGDRMDVVPEHTAYAAGDTARFQVRMPFREATALVTIEREGVLSSYVTQLSGRDPVVEVKLPGSYAPDVYVAVLAVRGRVAAGWWDWLRNLVARTGLIAPADPAPEPTATVDLARPSYRLGIAKVQVGWETHRLQVAVRADRDRYDARRTAKAEVAVRGPDGRPARSADVAFAAVDEALLQLAPNDSWDVLTAMMGDRPLAVLTSTAQTQVVGKRHYGRKAVETGGGGGGDLAALNRENFQPVLLWRGHVPLDANGRARVAVPLSDALSSFKLVAIASDGADRFGTGSTSIRTAQDLQVFAGLPPLVRTGDWFAAGFTLRNTSARAMTVTASVALSPGVARGRPLTVTIPAGGAVPIAWNLTAPDGPPNLRWQVSARSVDGRAADRLSVTQDIVPAVPVSTWAATLARVDTRIPIVAPAGALAGRGSVDVALSDSLAPPLAGVRQYMTDYPYDCFEQRLSRIVALGDARGWTTLAGAIPTYQAGDGLLRYWPSDGQKGSEALTAYVLSLASEAGLAIPEGPRARMIEGLKAVLDGRTRDDTYGDVRLQRLAALAALARAGAANPAMLAQIGIAPTEMPTDSLADYLVALDRIPAANAPALRAQAEAVLRHRLVFEGGRLDLADGMRNADWWLMGSGDEAAIKALLVVLGRPGWQDDGPRMMVGIALRQGHGHWDTTTANAWGTLAARRFAALYPASAVAGTTTLTLGSRSLNRGWPLAAAAHTVSLPLPPAPALLTLRQAGGAGPWASVAVRAAVPLHAPVMAGYRLTRTVEVVQARHPGRLTRGDVLRVTLTVDASVERNWVVVSDPVPAGATIVGDLGGQSRDLTAGEASAGISPAYVERGRDAFRGYYDWMPAGRSSIAYTVRLNAAGRFSLPPAHVEAMYSPAVHADLPNAPVVVGLP